MDDRRHEGLGDLLRSARVGRGLTQADLADQAGVSVGVVRDLEQGRSGRPRGRSLRALADALGLHHEDRERFTQLARPPQRARVEAPGPARLWALGPLLVTRAGRPVNLRAGRHRVVLARLALEPGRPVNRDELIHLLWGERPPPSAANVVQTHVSRIRRLLEPRRQPDPTPTVTLDSGGYRLHVDGEQLDLVAYRSRVAEAAAPTIPPRRAFDLLLDASTMWRGDDVVQDVPELSGDPLVTALAEERVEIAVRLARLGEVVGEQRQVLPLLRRLAGRYPWHESLHARLVVALAACGQQAAAIEAFESVRRRLADELGIDPGAELVEARQAVVSGEHVRAAGTSSVSGGAVTPRQTPAPPADFCGRADELRGIERALRYPRGGSPAVHVISGMAGVGKTSLALMAAWEVRRDFPDGQLYIDLRGSDDRPVPVAYALARLLRALGVEARSVPGDEREAAALYRSVLADRRVLVVLDNAHNAAQVRLLLPGPGGSAVLVTSRNRCEELDGAGATPLAVFTPTEALGLLRAALGETRVRTERRDAEALVEACGRLPIAVRLVAGRLAGRRESMIAEVVRGLTDERSRLARLSLGDRTVTSSFAISCRDLPPTAAEVFGTAALIPGESFSADAVAALLGVEPRAVRAALDHLVAENLLQPGDADRRYRYHDLLRLYALRDGETRGASVDRAAALGRLYTWYLARTASAMSLVYADMVRLPIDVEPTPYPFPDVDAATAWLGEEVGNLIAAVEAAPADGHGARSWELADQLRGYFFVSGDLVAWLASGAAGLAAAQAAGDVRAQAAMHQTIGQAHWAAGKHHLAADDYRRGIAAARASGWHVGEAYLSHNLGLVQAELGRPAEAQELYQRALDLGGGPEFHHVRAVTLNDLGTLCHERGQLTEAADHLKAAQRLNERSARHLSAMANRHNLAMVLRQMEDFEPARAHFEAALDYYRRTGSTLRELSVLDELSQLDRQLHEWVPAVNNAAEALRLARKQRNLRAEAATLNTLGYALLGSRAVEEAQARFIESLSISRSRGFQYFECQSTIGVAEAALLSDAAEQAYRAGTEALRIASRNAYRPLHADALIVQARAAICLGETETAGRHGKALRELLGTTPLPDRERACEAIEARLARSPRRRDPVVSGSRRLGGVGQMP
ncbi:BTAD domain-containing putative transcriptional regulator [Micromonospora sp. WMMD975]|uniref:BTAD domain-containing putative transcriptional regulator n=1 Tax=Micromonospora sp. WMMD975 TaxID=3016087 RepID=UPI00249B98B5|nr:BTAD domain-containing putative transcriptional regulator [Micromonospora sp. WMMD975]WFE35294.1 BTAD domain-containing putative transcriptional regulator [Micromonospora sp. WMMD975]